MTIEPREPCPKDGCDKPQLLDKGLCTLHLLAYARAKDRSRYYPTAHTSRKVPTRPIEQRAAAIKRAYGLTVAEYRAMEAAQSGACAICLSADLDLNIDHDHATGEVRGLLCVRCNSGIGMLGDSIERLQAAIGYLTLSSESRALWVNAR